MQMNPKGAQNYLRTRVFTATPEQLQLMLYDGAIRFTEQARPALERKDWSTSFHMLSRAQKIVTELNGSMKRDVAPDLCARMASLYNFVFRKLVEANVKHSLDALDDALRILRYQRDTWQLLMKDLGKHKAAAAAQKLDATPPDPRMEASISLRG
jgi:flagellar protein FliS